jgi:3',5'-cyclic AMP phosphodiesterase CpdA
MNKIVHISDLHFYADRRGWVKRKFWRLWYILRKIDTRLFTEQNATRLFTHIGTLKPSHIIVTGDLTTTGHEDEFKKAKELLYKLEREIKPNTDTEQGEQELSMQEKISDFKLNPKLFTIVPGNHDVVNKKKVKGKYSKLGLFFKYFGETIPDFNPDSDGYDSLFPFKKDIGKNIALIGINSTKNVSVHWAWRNAVGEIRHKQLDNLPDLLKTDKFKIVALHHHPLPVPYDDKFERWMTLKNSRRFLHICYTYGVNLILHGHKHDPFMWESNPRVPELDPPHQISILAAHAPTVRQPNARISYNVMEEINDTKGRICLSSKNYDWDHDEGKFIEKAGPSIGRRDTLELMEQFPDLATRTVYLHKYHDEVIENNARIWAYAQRFDYQIKEYSVNLKILEDKCLEYTKKVTLTGSKLPERNPIQMLRVYINGTTDIEYKDLELSIKPEDDNGISFLPCVDNPQAKKIIIVFLPAIEDDKDIRKYTLKCKWPGFWTKLFEDGKDSITEKPQSEGNIEKLAIRLTMDAKTEEIKPQKLKFQRSPIDGDITNIEKDPEGNSYCEWTLTDVHPNTEYTLAIEH